MPTVEIKEHPNGRQLIAWHSGRGFQDLSARIPRGTGIDDLLNLLDEAQPTPAGVAQLHEEPDGWGSDVWDLVATASNEDDEMPGGAVIRIYPEAMLEGARHYFNVRWTETGI